MYKKRSVIMIIIILSLLFFVSATAAGNGYRVQLGKSGASFRDTPNGAKIASIHADTYLCVFDYQDGWYQVYDRGLFGWVSEKQVVSVDRGSGFFDPSSSVKDVPYIGTKVYSLNSNGAAVGWVQAQLKVAGWYQGNQWLITGHLGKKTMSEIKSFMQSKGYTTHSGVVDQKVIDALYQHLGDSIVPVVYDKSSKEKVSEIMCSCGTYMTYKVSVGGYTFNENGHCLDSQTTFTCPKCGNQQFEGAPGEGEWVPHSFNSQNLCPVCGYQK